MKITGLSGGTVGDEEAELLGGGWGDGAGGGGGWEDTEQSPCRPVSAVNRPTAAGDVELSVLNGSYPHTHTHTQGLFARVCVCVCVGH